MLFLLTVLPLWRLLVRALDIDALTWLINDRQARRALQHSALISTTVATITSVLALGLTLLLEKTNLPQRRVFRVMLFVPLTIPPQILTIAWLSWAGSAGLLQDLLRANFNLTGRLWTLYNPRGIVLLLVIFTLPVAYLTIAAGLRNISRSLEDAARVEGASLRQVWQFVTVPLLAPHVAAGFMLSFLAALGNFGIQALLGIPARFITLPTLIYRKVTSFSSGSFDQAAALALLLGVPALIILGLQHTLLKRDQRSLEMTLDAPQALPARRVALPADGVGLGIHHAVECGSFVGVTYYLVATCFWGGVIVAEPDSRTLPFYSHRLRPFSEGTPQ